MTDYDILYVEDNVGDRGITQRKLERAGYTVNSCGTLDEMEGMFRDNTYRMFILDGDFPDCPRGPVNFNFPKAVSLIQALYEEPKILLFTGHEAKDVAEEHGARFLKKNVYAIRELSSIVEEML